MRPPTIPLCCPKCEALLGLRSDALAWNPNPTIEGEVLDAAREFALAWEDTLDAGLRGGEYERALARLKDACSDLLDLDLNAEYQSSLRQEISDWLPTLSAAESLVFGVVALRGVLKLSPPASLTRLADTYETATNMVADYRAKVDQMNYRAERDDWIQANGPQRLRLILAEGLVDGSDAAYRDERLKRERPGWCWIDYRGSALGKLSPPRNPPLSAFAVLSEARKSDPAATLAFATKIPSEDPALSRRYVARGMFLGRMAVYPDLRPRR